MQSGATRCSGKCAHTLIFCLLPAVFHCSSFSLCHLCHCTYLKSRAEGSSSSSGEHLLQHFPTLPPASPPLSRLPLSIYLKEALPLPHPSPTCLTALSLATHCFRTSTTAYHSSLRLQILETYIAANPTPENTRSHVASPNQQLHRAFASPPR